MIRTIEGARGRGTHVVIRRRGLASFTLRTTQVVGINAAATFAFLEEPDNLPFITPPWLDFKIISNGGSAGVFEGAEFDYTIRWFGIRIPWRSMITEYTSGVSFTDRQLSGPYSSWVHRHLFREVAGGTFIEDLVDYTLPLSALLLSPVIRSQLEDIFSFRSQRILWCGPTPSISNCSETISQPKRW